MKRRFIAAGVLFFILLLVTTPCVAEQNEPSAENYKNLLEKVKNQDESVNFQLLRFSYAKTEDYNPYNPPDYEPMQKAYEDGKWDETISLANDILKTNYVDIEAHAHLALSYQKKGDEQNTSYHQYVFVGLMDSILKNGDGESEKTAYTVISIREEYVVMNFFGLNVNTQNLTEADGHNYDEIAVEDPETGQTGNIYFNVDIPLSWLEEELKKANVE